MLGFLVRPEGLEPPAYWFEASRSIQLSYGRMASSYHPKEYRFIMAVETEIKLRLTRSAEDTRALLEQHGFQATGPRQLETDQTFDLPTGELRLSGRLLRLRSAGGRWTVTYKGPADASARHKSREEIEVDVSDGAAFTQILERLGYQPAFAYEKFRTTFKSTTFGAQREDGIVTLDETPIGDFLELEGPGYWIDQAAVTLGFEPADYITSSYAALYEEHRRTHATVPRDMQFHRP
jgi:adenylate cyclase class 2